MTEFRIVFPTLREEICHFLCRSNQCSFNRYLSYPEFIDNEVTFLVTIPKWTLQLDESGLDTRLFFSFCHSLLLSNSSLILPWTISNSCLTQTLKQSQWKENVSHHQPSSWLSNPKKLSAVCVHSVLCGLCSSATAIFFSVWGNCEAGNHFLFFLLINILLSILLVSF